MKKIVSSFCIAAAFIVLAACNSGRSQTAGVRTDALDDSAWESSEWISVVDAPVVEGEVKGASNYRSADGANWFVASQKNHAKVVSAVWMTSALGTYDLFVNGKVIGCEVLKPGINYKQRTKNIW